VHLHPNTLDPSISPFFFFFHPISLLLTFFFMLFPLLFLFTPCFFSCSPKFFGCQAPEQISVWEAILFFLLTRWYSKDAELFFFLIEPLFIVPGRAFSPCGAPLSPFLFDVTFNTHHGIVLPASLLSEKLWDYSLTSVPPSLLPPFFLYKKFGLSPPRERCFWNFHPATPVQGHLFPSLANLPFPPREILPGPPFEGPFFFKCPGGCT